MTLVTLKSILNNAKKGNYAVGAFNVVNLEMISYLIKAAEYENKPIIIQYAEGDDSRIPLEDIAIYAHYLIKKTKIPVCLHLDHGKDFSIIMRAIKAGYSSVMIDASNLPYEQNVKMTKEIVKIAHSVNVSVEAEIGRMINSEHESTSTSNLKLEESFTSPSMAERFAKETESDAIAVSFGTIHGVYAEKPKLDYRRLSEISSLVKQPLVVHGGSGLTEQEYKKIIELGISKINFYSEMSYSVTKKIIGTVNKNINDGEKQFIQDLVDLEKEYVIKELSSKINLFSNNYK